MDLRQGFLCFVLLSLAQGIQIEQELIVANQQELEVVRTERESKTSSSGAVKQFYSAPGSHENSMESDKKLSQELSYETAWTQSGKRKLTIMKVVTTNVSSGFHDGFSSEFDAKFVDDADDLPTSVRRRWRYRRELFGQHRRYYIPTRSFAQRFPFQVVVKISTGCTGSLVSSRHVLTSAHCLHTGKDYAKGFRSLRVGFLLPNKTIEWINAHQVKLPLAWVQGNDTDASRFDYAIIKLARKHHRRPMPLSYSQGTRFGRKTKIHFTAFEDDKPANTIWYRSCSILAATNDMMYHCCDAQPGSSGAGVYVYYNNRQTGEQDRILIGVFSGNRIVPYHPWWPYVGCPPVWRGNFNAAIRFSPLKFKQICHWIGMKHAINDCRRYLMSLSSRDPPQVIPAPKHTKSKKQTNKKKKNKRRRKNREAKRRARERARSKKLRKRKRDKKNKKSGKKTRD